MFCFVIKQQAQNLVPNPSFEILNTCTLSTISNAPPWCAAPTSMGPPAVLYPCSSDSYLRAPKQYLDNCFKSYQTVRSGIAYAHMGGNPQGSQNESIIPQVKLLDTLEAGKIYCVTYYVSMWNNAKYSIDKLGALLTPTPFPCYSAGDPTVAIAGQYAPQVVTPAGMVFEDTLHWEEVSGSFTAAGNEAYLALGNFFLNNQHLVKNSYPTNCNGVSEYYIDDVSVEEVHPARCKSDTTIMYGDSAVIGNNLSEATLYSWQPTAGLSCTNCANPKASPTVSTTYTVIKTQCKSVTTDVIFINVDNVGLNELNINAVTQIAPNPTDGMLNVELGMLNGSAFIEVYNSMGQQVFREEITTQHSSFDLHHLNEGIYFVKIVYPNGMSVVQKVVVSQ